MAEPTSATMATLFSNLIGRRVNFTEQPAAVPANGQQIYCVYLIKPMDSSRILIADMSLLGSFAAALIGLPSEAVKERLADATIDENLRDALHEVMNIASRIVSTEHRAVFNGMYGDTGQLSPEARNIIRNPCYSNYFRVTVDGYTGGALSMAGPF